MPRYLNFFLLAGLLSGGLAADLRADCGGEPCVLVYRGKLDQNTGVSPADTWVKEVELGDVDGDGWLDLIMLQKLPGLTIEQMAPQRDILYLGGADPAFNFQLGDPVATAFERKANAFPASVMANRGYDVEIADLNNDDDPDIVRVDIPGQIDLLIGQGDGTFTHHNVVSAIGGDPNAQCLLFGAACNGASACGGTYDDVDVADLDHDGDLDFVVGQYAACGDNLVIRNDMSSGPGVPPGLPPPLVLESVPGFDANFTHAVSIGDANGDCQLDVLFGNWPHAGFGTDASELFLGQSPTSIQYALNPDKVFTEIAAPQVTSIGDIVGDLALDCGGDDGIPKDLPDLTGDGDADVFLAQSRADGDSGLYINTGSASAPYGSLVECDLCSDIGRYDIRYRDFDQDGAMEGLMVEQNFGEDAQGSCVWDTQLQIVRFDLTGYTEVSSELIDTSVFVGANVGGIAVATGDLDLDGDDDVVLGGVRHVGPVVPTSADCDTANGPTLFGAAHLYENQLFSQVGGRVIDRGDHVVQARQQVTGTDGLTIEGSAQVTFEALGKVVLEDGVTISPASGRFTARTF